MEKVAKKRKNKNLIANEIKSKEKKTEQSLIPKRNKNGILCVCMYILYTVVHIFYFLFLAALLHNIILLYTNKKVIYL